MQTDGGLSDVPPAAARRAVPGAVFFTKDSQKLAKNFI
jgi:hypothetical protein